MKTTATALEAFFATCPRGLEGLLAEDLVAVGASEVRAVPGGALFQGTRETCYRANLESRIATRVLWRVGKGAYASEDDLYRLALSIDWPTLFNVDYTLRVHVTAQKAPVKSVEFVTLRLKDAICDRFREVAGRRPSVDTRHPDVRMHAFLTASEATLYMDTSGEPLYLRGHKLAKVGAPLKENLAAGILRLAGWTPDTPLLDPMCGSGTFLIEAAQMALQDAPGLSRDPGEFGFERLAGFDAALWRRLQVEAAERRIEAPAQLPIWGSDRDPDAVARTCQNLAHAGLDDLIRVERADILERQAPAPTGVLICNPPYGERLGDTAELAAFYPHLGNALKQHYAGWNCHFLSADPQFPKLLGLKPSRKMPLFNGNLECRLFAIPVVAGTHRRR
jgi:putative N6-adenine-specific DNA methylase